MFKKSLPYQPLTLISTSLLLSGSFSSYLLAQPFSLDSSFNPQPYSSFLLASDYRPPNLGTTGNTRKTKTGVRRNGDLYLVALVPQAQAGVTYAEFPSFWVYFAEELSPDEPATFRFILKDEMTGDLIYQTNFQLQQGAGIFHFQLPQTAPPLEIGRKYLWKVSILYKNREDASVEDAIARISRPSAFNSQFTPQERLTFYAQNGIWYDLVAELAKLHYLNPEDKKLTSQWHDLLKDADVQLETLAEKPLLSCCSPTR